eukprot:4793985-Prymnesium_polylepis.1
MGRRRCPRRPAAPEAIEMRTAPIEKCGLLVAGVDPASDDGRSIMRPPVDALLDPAQHDEA